MLSNSARVLSAKFSYGFDNQASAAQPARHALDLRAHDLSAVQPALLFLRSYPVEMVQCELRELLIVVAITVQLSV